MKNKETNKQSFEFDVEMLLKEYNSQINTDGKHSYDEHLHNDTGSGCCLCDMCECLYLCTTC